MAYESLDPRKLVADLRQTLPHEVTSALDNLALGAAPAPLFAVGGTARDIILGRALVDVDIVVEGDAISIAKNALPDARITTHLRFGTAKMTIAGTRIDLASARRESYAKPGALPRVEPASIDEDLRRRDFSVNSLALRLGTDPALLDPCGGVEDLDLRRIRSLHDRSFIDDATRIFRALRYSARLRFQLEAETAEQMRAALPYVNEIGGERLRREIELMFSEETAGAALEAAQSFGVLQAVHPALHWSADKTRTLERRNELAVQLLPFGFALLAAGASDDEAAVVVNRLKLKRDEAAAVVAVAALRGMSEILRRQDAKPSGIAMVLDRYPAAAVAAYAMTTGNAAVREMVLQYVDVWRNAKPLLTAKDLIALGIPPGPQLQRGLQLVRAARLDGWASDRDDERALMMRFAKSIHDSETMTSPLPIEGTDD